VRVDIEPIASDAPFHAHATLQSLPGVQVARLGGSPTRFNRTAALAAEGSDWIGMIINVDGPSFASQRGHDVTLAAGDAIAVLPQEAGC